MTIRTEPMPTLDPEEGSGIFQSRKIKLALTGRIRSMCVYCSSCRARANVEIRGPHQIAREIATRIQKTRNGGNFEIDPEFGLLDTMFCFKS